MYNLLKIETFKLLKNKRTLIVFIITLFFIVLSIFLTYRQINHENDFKGNLLMYGAVIFSLNNQIIFPLLIAVFFAPIITEEFNLRTYYLLRGSRYSDELWFIMKFIAGGIVFFSLFTLVLVISLVFVQVFLLHNSMSVDAGYLILSGGQIFVRLSLAIASSIIYLICFASFVMVISLLTRHFLFTILIIFVLMVLYSIIPIPDEVNNFIFLYGQGVTNLLGEVDFPWSRLLTNTLIDIASMLIFMILGVTFVTKIKLKN